MANKPIAMSKLRTSIKAVLSGAIQASDQHPYFTSFNFIPHFEQVSPSLPVTSGCMRQA